LGLALRVLALPRLVIGVGCLPSRLPSIPSSDMGICIRNDCVVDMTGRAGLLHLLEIDRIGAHLTRLLIDQGRYVLTGRHGPREFQGSEWPIAGVRNLIERLGLTILFLWRGVPNTSDKELASGQNRNLRLWGTRASHDEQARDDNAARFKRHRQGIRGSRARRKYGFLPGAKSESDRTQRASRIA
jgi:hypothetical protein